MTPPEALPPLKWSPPDVEGLVAFLAGEKGFDEARVRAAAKRITASKGKSAQGRLESFFGPTTIKSSDTGKRKEPEPAKGGKGGGGAKGGPAMKKGKLGGVGGGKKK